MRDTPTFWILLCTRFLGTSQGFAHRLWKRYPVSRTLMWQLGLFEHSPASSPDTWTSRAKHLGELLPPAWLLQTSLRMEPETGRPRAREHIAFEEAVLQALDRDGQWKW